MNVSAHCRFCFYLCHILLSFPEIIVAFSYLIFARHGACVRQRHCEMLILVYWIVLLLERECSIDTYRLAPCC